MHSILRKARKTVPTSGPRVGSITDGDEDMGLRLFAFEDADAGGDALDFDSAAVRPFVDELVHHGQGCVV